ncbi:MAG: hypothetical protein R2707_05725 [Acidimicrobiales bacterium]
MRLTGDDPLAGLEKWLADGRVDAAAAERARRRWLERQATEDASVAGVCLDLAERNEPVAVRTSGGRSTRGRVTALGADFVVVREERVGDVVIPLRCVATIRAAPGGGAVPGERSAGFSVVLAEALVELAAERPLVLVSVGGDEIRGELRSAGTDVVALATASVGRDLVHVAIAAIDHLVLLRG